MGVSAIILTKNSKTTLRDCLESVVRNNPEEIIVVDGYSTDSTLDIVRQYTNKIYCDERSGICYARQLGAEMATQEYILYIDSDVTLQPDTLKTMLTELRQEAWDAIAALAVDRESVRGAVWKHPGERKATIPMFCTILRRDLVLKYRFDPKMPNCDDFEISYKLRQNGHRFGVSSAHAFHAEKTLKNAAKNTYRCGAAIAEFFWKYKGSPATVTRYVILGGLGFNAFKVLTRIAQGKPHLIPRYVFVTAVLYAGFAGKLSRILLDTLKRNRN